MRPRDAASLILLRGEGKDLEVLAGRRPLHVRFMPGVQCFPAARSTRRIALAWNVESGTEALGPKLARVRPRGLARDLGRSRGAGRPPG